MMTEHERWLLSFYRISEIGGSLFFGRLARTLRPGPVQHDMTKHFADEAQHAWAWTDCLQRLEVVPLELPAAYQDRYLEAAGLPANLMEVLTLTQVFEQRVFRQYRRHARSGETHPLVRETLERIMTDEAWHLRWIRGALKRLEPDYGREAVLASLERYRQADATIYRRTETEQAERLSLRRAA